MSDTTATVTETDGTSEENTVTETETTGTETTETETESTEDADLQRTKTELEKVRREAAKYRVAAREASEKAKTEAEVAVADKLQELSDKQVALTDDLDKANATILKLTAAVEAGVPTDQLLDFASLLPGTSPEEIKASAEKAAKLLGPNRARAVDPSQGAVGGAKQEVTPGIGRLQAAYSSKSQS